MKQIVTEIVKRAMLNTVTDMGQLTHEQKRELNYAVKHNALSKGKGGPFPILKTMWALPGFDFAADRERRQSELYSAHMIDVARGAAKFFPWVAFQEVSVYPRSGSS